MPIFDRGEQPLSGLRDRIRRRHANGIEAFGARKLLDQMTEFFRAQKSSLA
jgi:hypothetical protein